MKNYKYSYFVKPLRNDSDKAYEALIPKFNTVHVFADTIQNLHESVMEAIHLEIQRRKKHHISIPEPDTKSQFNGKILLRIGPLLHEQLFFQAQANSESLNAYIENALEKIA